jgi:predicted transcriptional regulator
MFNQGLRSIGTLEESQTAKSAWKKSCYFEMDFTISEDASVYEAVQKFAAYDVGCLVTTDSAGKFHSDCT